VERRGSIVICNMASPAVQVAAKTWKHEKLNLFDFEAGSETLQTTSFTIQGSATCVQSGETIWSVEGAVPSKSKPLLKCRQRDGAVEIDAVSSASNSRKPWMVVQDLPGGHQALVEGDIIMLGRATLQVCQIVTGVHEMVAPDVLGDGVGFCEDSGDNYQCRICLMDGCSLQDPFVAPCRCRGSVEKVHLSCLRQWTKTRLNFPACDTVDSFVYQTPICEMCKADYPAFIRQSDESCTPLVDNLPSIAPPYVVLQSIAKSSKHHAQEQRVSYHANSFAQQDKILKIGRGHECSVRLDEVSMSRWHASIKFSNGQFFIEDHNSKFGTLLALQQPLLLQADTPISVKVGRTILSFAVPSLPQPLREQLQNNSTQRCSPCNLQVDVAFNGSNDKLHAT